MEMLGPGLGIYGIEIEPILRCVRVHEDLDAIEANPCPCCGSPIRVDFWPGGHSYTIRCLGKPMHMAVCQHIDRPPRWWIRRVIEPVESIETHFVD